MSGKARDFWVLGGQGAVPDVTWSTKGDFRCNFEQKRSKSDQKSASATGFPRRRRVDIRTVLAHPWVRTRRAESVLNLQALGEQTEDVECDPAGAMGRSRRGNQALGSVHLKYSYLGRISTDSAHSWTGRELQASPRRPSRNWGRNESPGSTLKPR